MKRLSISLMFLMAGLMAAMSQKVLDLSGMWEFGMGETAHYDGFVELPGSMLTNEK